MSRPSLIMNPIILVGALSLPVFFITKGYEKKEYKRAYNKVLVRYADKNKDGIVTEEEKSELFKKIIKECGGREYAFDGEGFIDDKGKEINKNTLTKWLNEYDSRMNFIQKDSEEVKNE